MQTNHNIRALRRNPLIVITLISLAALHFNVSASTGTVLFTATDYDVFDGDTLKMVSGVPLKPEDISPLLAGEQIPMLRLPKSSGELFDLNRSVSETPTILVFYRGGWCPYCSKQLAGLQDIEKDLTNMGYQLIAISTDSPDNLAKTIGKEQLSYTLLSDADLTAAKRFGIAYKSPESYDKFLPETSGGKNVDKLLPVPAVFILDREGNILFEYINPNISQRLSAPLLKAAATALREEF